MTLDTLLTHLVTADNRMTTVSHLCINTGASELAMQFQLSDWISLINWTHLLQSETHVQYFDSSVCSGVIKVKINSVIY